MLAISKSILKWWENGQYSNKRTYGFMSKTWFFSNTRYPKYPMILKINRVRIGYWKIFRVRVGYRVPVGPCWQRDSIIISSYDDYHYWARGGESSGMKSNWFSCSRPMYKSYLCDFCPKYSNFLSWCRIGVEDDRAISVVTMPLFPISLLTEAQILHHTAPPRLILVPNC